MKLKVKGFETYAKLQGYENGVELFESIGFSEEDYQEYVEGKDITRKVLLKLYYEIGTEVIDFLSFEGSEWEKNIDLFDKF